MSRAVIVPADMYTGTAGRTENAQVAVYLAYAAPAESAFIDRALYLPRSWTSSGLVPGRRDPAGHGVRDQARAGQADDHPGARCRGAAGWVTADEVYGQDPALRAGLARRGLGYVLAVAKSHQVTTGIGPRPVVRDRRRRARCVPDRPVDPGHLRLLADIPTWPLTCALAGLSLAAHVLLSSGSRSPVRQAV
jgi:DDE superfamily endonuclease